MATLNATAIELAQVAARLKKLGEDGLRRQLTAAIKKGADPVPDAIRRGLVDYLPDPYAAVLEEDLRITVSVRPAAADPGVFVVGTPIRKRRKVGTINAGNLRHPVFGQHGVPRRRWTWRDQLLPSVRPGFFTGPAEDDAPRVREEIEKALTNVKRQIEGGH